MATPKQVLKIEPATELVFQGPFEKNVTTTLKLTNPSQESICFKVLVTAPSVYTIKPNKGIISPKQATEVLVTLRSFKYDENQIYKHKVMVRSMLARDDVLEERLDQMWKELAPDLLMAKKLNCVLMQAEVKGTLMPRELSMKPDVTPESYGRGKQFVEHVLVASIDIGNTYTRCGFLFKNKYHKDPTKIKMLYQICPAEVFTENPTMMLMDDNNVFDSFGYDALDKYMEYRQGHLFREIKLPLYQKLTADKDKHIVQIKDELGQQIPAVEMFQAIINHFKNHLHAELGRKTRFLHDDIYWVITVPAVFTNRTVSVVETAVMQSGIAKHQFNITTEPVAALEYCETMHKYRKDRCIIHQPGGCTSSEENMFQDGRQCMVIDIGGETVDVTIIQKDLGRNVTEHYKVCVIGCGGKSIHEALDKVLADIVGHKEYQRFRTEEYRRDCYRSFHKAFDLRLKDYATHSDKVITVGAHGLHSLQSADHFKTLIGLSPYASEMKVLGDKLKFSACFWKGLVAEYCSTLVKQLKDVFEKISYDKNICLLIVGGYANFKTIQESLIKDFNDLNIFIPDEPQFATVGGSVSLGHCPPLRIHRVPNGQCTIVRIEDDQSKASDFEVDNQAIASHFVQSVSEMSISSDFIEDESIPRSSQIQTGLKSLSQRMLGKPQEISVRRTHITADVITSYGDIDVSRPLKVCFAGEGDRDRTREMFGLFWEKICGVWFRGENAAIPLVSVDKRAEARRAFPILGKILEHTLCIVGHFPPQICRSLIIAIAHPDQDVDADLVLDDYLLYVLERDRSLLSQSLAMSDWSENRTKRLSRFFSVNKIPMHPKPMSFKEDLVNIAFTEIIDASHVYVALMRRGISEFALKHFFDVLDTDGVRTEYDMVLPTTENVVKMIEDMLDEAGFSREEKIIINYLSNIVSDMSKKQLRQFLIWLTGSPCMPQEINMTFRTSQGRSKLPVAHTDSYMLELSREYSSYQDFERVLNDVLSTVFAEESDS